MLDRVTDRLLSRLLAAGDRPHSSVRHLHREAVVAASLEETFSFFSDASNLELLTPAWLRFTIRTPTPIVMGTGAEIAYRIRLWGVPIPWRTRIVAWQPCVRFVDRQLVGPYRWWDHEHRFETVPGGTLVIDHVEYVPRAGWLSGPLVRRDLARIFDYRSRTLGRLFRAGDREARP
jgi:ligand-binding SRPBCC domain-containing protein